MVAIVKYYGSLFYSYYFSAAVVTEDVAITTADAVARTLKT